MRHDSHSAIDPITGIVIKSGETKNSPVAAQKGATRRPRNKNPNRIIEDSDDDLGGFGDENVKMYLRTGRLNMNIRQVVHEESELIIRH